MEIQQLQAHETERLRSLRLRALQDSPEAFESSYEEAVPRPFESWGEQLRTMATFVAIRGGHDVGLARGDLDKSCKQWVWLRSMWVEPSARGQQVGEALVDAVVRWAREQGASRLLLDVGDDNAPAVRLYARKGFERTGETSSLPPPRQHIREHRRSLDLRSE